MDPVIHKFRSSLGGFHRRDVMQYIEQLSAAHRGETARLRKELDDCENERARLQDTLAGLESEKGSVAAEEARVRASLEQSTASLARLRGELSETEQQLTAARGELEHCRQEMAELAPLAKSYQQLKDRVATVELDAHRKAQATVDEAKAEAEQLREETRRWLSDVLEHYADVRGAVDELLRSARDLAALEEQVSQADAQAQALKEKIGL